MQIKNTNLKYGIVTILLHWIMAVLIIGMLVLGLYMVTLTSGPFKVKLYIWHKEYGFIILIFACLRLLWRIYNIAPSLANITPLERFSACSLQWIFYVLMIIMPLTGWLLSSAAGRGIIFFNVVNIPPIISPDNKMKLFFGSLHESLAYILIFLIFLHITAAFYHHLMHKNNILRRMFPRF